MDNFKIFTITLCIILTGCGTGLPDGELLEKSFVEVTLKDGTRCVVFKDRISQGGNITCDWECRDE